MRASAQRIRSRRGSNVATIAVARKLCVLCWHLLTRGEDYASARPSLTKANCGAWSCSPAPRAAKASVG
jgi:hypothetical protein